MEEQQQFEYCGHAAALNALYTQYRQLDWQQLKWATRLNHWRHCILVFDNDTPWWWSLFNQPPPHLSNASHNGIMLFLKYHSMASHFSGGNNNNKKNNQRDGYCTNRTEIRISRDALLKKWWRLCVPPTLPDVINKASWIHSLGHKKYTHKLPAKR